MKKVFLSLLVASMMLAGCGKDKVENGSNSKSESTTKNDLQNSLVGTTWSMEGNDTELGGTFLDIISFTSDTAVTLTDEIPFKTGSDGVKVKERISSVDGCITYTYSAGSGEIIGDFGCKGVKYEIEQIKQSGGTEQHKLITAVLTGDFFDFGTVTVKEGDTTKTYNYSEGDLSSSEEGGEVADKEKILEKLMEIYVKLRDERQTKKVMQISSVTEESITVTVDSKQRVYKRVK